MSLLSKRLVGVLLSDAACDARLGDTLFGVSFSGVGSFTSTCSESLDASALGIASCTKRSPVQLVLLITASETCGVIQSISRQSTQSCKADKTKGSCFGCKA